MTGTVTIRPVTLRDLGMSPGAIAARAMFAEVSEKIGARKAMRGRAAFDGIEYVVDDVLTLPKPGEAGKAIRVLDDVLPGEAVVLLTDPHPRHYFNVAQVWIHTISAARDRRLTAGTRRRRALALARGVWRDALGPAENRRPLEIQQRTLIELAALILDDTGLAQLGSMTGAVPLVSLVVDTRAARPTAENIHSLVIPLSGPSLGTAQTAGSA
ncbi:hypothetical protein MKK88_18735 [Methylobacterium sp. E-005]|uniref:hypothetical protein n=1 Tax=Methylobacterium sp. E-005 TaxID=2836549 RepID=UPI001FBB8D4C|nr:hypothetical protein [Methylobacterium sp. E-005]MCJ2088003.1 hypothetical protein [Methylobacterium sp. E-005]